MLFCCESPEMFFGLSTCMVVSIDNDWISFFWDPLGSFVGIIFLWPANHTKVKDSLLCNYWSVIKAWCTVECLCWLQLLLMVSAELAVTVISSSRENSSGVFFFHCLPCFWSTVDNPESITSWKWKQHVVLQGLHWKTLICWKHWFECWKKEKPFFWHKLQSLTKLISPVILKFKEYLYKNSQNLY